MNEFRRTKYACYSTNVTMSVVGNLTPLLLLALRSGYGFSYSQLGLLIAINFTTQLIIDLVFSFFSDKFNIPKVVRLMPFLAVFGFAIYALAPNLFPNSVYIGLVIGTILFSCSSGLAEVLMSPMIAAIPSKNPDAEMSKLHSAYAWGVVAFVIFSTLFLSVVGRENWQWLVAILTLIPITSCVLFLGAKIPNMQTPENTSSVLNFLKNKGVWLCMFAIFLGGASECTMSQWASGYLERALGIPKAAGDILGVAMFALTLGIGRSWYAKCGKNIKRVLCLGAGGALICYLLAVFSPSPVIGLIACALTGFCTSMLWPGCLILSSDRYPNGGVLLYALMAAGGDLGAALVPQLVGVATDVAIQSANVSSLAAHMGITIEQFGMKMGMLFGAIFPLLAFLVLLYIWKSKKAKN